MHRKTANSALLIIISLICSCASGSSRHDKVGDVKRINACINGGGTWDAQYNYCQPDRQAQKEQEKWINIEIDKIKKQHH